MKLRSSAAAMAVIFIIGIAAIAQGVQASPAKGPRQDMFQRFSQAVGLTPDQASKIKPIVDKFRADVKEVRASNLPEQQKWDKIMQFREDERNAILANLTPDQQVKAKAFWASERQRKAERFASKLGLTEDQKATIKSITENARAQAQAIKADTSLDPATKQARLQALHKETKDKIDAVLTPEQRAKLQQMKKGHRCR